MARLLASGTRFDALAPTAILKPDYLQLLVAHEKDLFPGFQLVAFDRPHIYEQDEAVPDFVLIDEQYKSWWIAVVQMAYKSMEEDILPDISILHRTTYGILDAEHLLATKADLDAKALTWLTIQEQPNVVVITNAPRPGWREPIEREGAILCIVEVFQSADGQRVLRINGDQPTFASRVVTTCQVDPTHPRMVTVDSPEVLVAEVEEDPFPIEYNGATSGWVRITMSDTVLLSAETATPLPKTGHFALIRIGDGRLLFRHLPAPTGGV